MNKLFIVKTYLTNEINKIPASNKQKFSKDLIILIKKAQEPDYENFNLK